MNIYLASFASIFMGKIKKAHRKKVQARNAKIQAKRKELMKALQPPLTKQEYIVQNYEALTDHIAQPEVLELLQADGPQFR